MIVNILLFIFALSLIIALHELGHLVAAKSFGVLCFEYSIGMGPKLYSKKINGTIYSLRAIPFGGFVAMAGEMENNEEMKQLYHIAEIKDSETLSNKPKWQRVIVLMAGIFMNFVLAYVIFVVLLLYKGNHQLPRDNHIEAVLKNSMAEKAGLKANDQILRVTFEDGLSFKVKSVDDFSAYLATKGGKVKFDIKRDNQIIKDVEVESVKKDNYYVIGIKLPEFKTIKINFFNALYYGAISVWEITRMMIVSLINLFKGIGLKDISGPLGIYQVSAQAVKAGIDVYFRLIALISINIGLLNTIPIPALDGGRVMLVLIEAIIRKPLNKNFEKYLIIGSMILLLCLMLLATFKDIFRLFF